MLLVSDKVSWLYFRIYPPNRFALDELVRHGIPKILKSQVFRSWFFIRYRDASGLHLRLRLCVPTDEETMVQDTVEAILRDGMPSQVAQGTASALHYEIDRYVPELRYFGERGIYVAEQLFQISSETAISILEIEAKGFWTRRRAAPILMRHVHETFAPREHETSFWTQYAAHWFKLWHGTEEPVRRQASLRRERYCSNQDAWKSQAVIQNTVNRWRRATERAAVDYAALDEVEAKRTRNLAFQFIHLMNNRLGIYPLEEAGIATLLAEQGGEGAQ
jgi:thiopeptide-type bacteriocin biosynthesis protein